MQDSNTNHKFHQKATSRNTMVSVFVTQTLLKPNKRCDKLEFELLGSIDDSNFLFIPANLSWKATQKVPLSIFPISYDLKFIMQKHHPSANLTTPIDTIVSTPFPLIHPLHPENSPFSTQTPLINATHLPFTSAIPLSTINRSATKRKRYHRGRNKRSYLKKLTLLPEKSRRLGKDWTRAWKMKAPLSVCKLPTSRSWWNFSDGGEKNSAEKLPELKADASLNGLSQCF